MGLAEFIQSPVKNQHVYHPEFALLYVRKSNRYIRGEWYRGVFDIAAVEAIEPGQGAFGRLLTELFGLWVGPIYVECVQTPRFAKYLLRHNFVIADGADCYILLRG